VLSKKHIIVNNLFQTYEHQNYAHSRTGTGRFDGMQRRKTRKSNGTER
jgi:hypothetical protein